MTTCSGNKLSYKAAPARLRSCVGMTLFCKDQFHAFLNVSSIFAGLRDRSKRPFGCSRQGSGPRGGEKNRPVGSGGLAPGPRHVFVQPADTSRLRPGQESARLAGVEPPKFEDTETTLDQLKERITKTVAFLKTLDTKAIDGSS